MSKDINKGNGSAFLWLALATGIAIAGYLVFKNFGATNSKLIVVPEQASMPAVKILEQKGNAAVSTYMKPEYADQVLLAAELKVLLIKGENFNHILNQIIALSISDEVIKSDVDNLRAIGKVPNMPAIVMQYEQMRGDITKEVYKEKYNKIPLLPWILKKVTIQSRGDRAMNSGPPESILEIAAQDLAKQNLLEAHKQILTLDEKYKAHTEKWLENAQKYLTAQALVQNVLEYITSAEYKNKFTRKCAAIDKE